MQIIEISRTALTALTTNKTRSVLTILGIVIGITAIILIMSLGSGAQTLILGQLGGFGSNLVVIRPGKEPTGPSDFAQTIFADSLKQRDVDALMRKSNVPELDDLAPAVVVPGSVSYGSETYRPQIFGWSAQFLSTMFNVTASQGELFGKSEIDQKASVAVIGDKVRKELFGQNDVIGKNIRIKDRNFRVIGLLAPKGQVGAFNVDDLVLLPYTTAQTYLLGIDYYNEIMVRVADTDMVPRTVTDIQVTLRQTHDITDPAKDDFYVVTAEGLISQVQVILSALTAFLSSVVAISLLVGGIGVMNIMLVSVTERTREIGLRKALGATNKDILTQFLLESVILTVSGGIIGMILGAIFSYLIALVLTKSLGIDWHFVYPISAVVLGFGVAGIIGLIFGIFPARKAAQKSPMEALRYE